MSFIGPSIKSMDASPYRFKPTLISPKPIHALLASKRRLIDLQKTPFKTLTNALLKSN